MSYSYSNPVTYSDNYPVYQQQNKSSGSAAAGTVGALIGGGTGAFIGFRKNPYMKNDQPTDTFTKRVFKKFLKNAPENDKKTYSQLKAIMKKLNKVSTVDELKTLLNNNPEGSKEIFNVMGQDSASFLKNVNETSLNATKSAIKDKISSSDNMMLQDLKNQIIKFWNPEKKNFEKPANGDTAVFDAIKSAKKGMKFKQIAKWSAIGVAACGVLCAILQKIISHKKSVSQ